LISEEIIQKIKEENDIVDIISENVRLKRAGRNYMGLCPFHNEKTPSFSVSPDRQIFKCFGCGEAGDVITFLMKLKNLSFFEACIYLAERANIEIDASNNQSKSQKDKFERLYRLNVESARFFFNNLKVDETAKSYFLRRGIDEKTIKKFGLGYSLDSWNGLLKFLKSKGYSELDMLSLGLIVKSAKGNFYDRFRNRVIFPVFNYKGKVIGFGGRVLDDSKPKYLNSPETILFKKGTNLYGLNFAIKNNNNNMFIIVEGYMDCISLHQYGITNVVASLGTAFTVNQAKLLKRYAQKIIIAYDADSAGQAATLRGLEILRNEGFDVNVLTVPEGKDPDEFIKNNGKGAFLKLIDESISLIEYRIKKAAEGIDFNKREMLIQYVKKVTSIIADLDPVEKDVYIKKISEETGIKEKAIYDLLRNELQKNVRNSENLNIDENFRQKLYLEPAYIKDERIVLKLMLSQNSYRYIIEYINAEDMIVDAHKKIFNLIVESYNLNKEDKLKYIQLKCDDIESSKEFINIQDIDSVEQYDDETITKLVNNCLVEIQKYKLEESKKDIMKKIKQCESKGLIAESIKLAQSLIEIQNKLESTDYGERR
jgi:DNA primase